MEELKNALKSLLDRVDPEDPVDTMEGLAKQFEAEVGLPAPRKPEKMSEFDQAYYNFVCDKYNEWRRKEWKEFCNGIRKLL